MFTFFHHNTARFEVNRKEKDTLDPQDSKDIVTSAEFGFENFAIYFAIGLFKVQEYTPSLLASDRCHNERESRW